MIWVHQLGFVCLFFFQLQVTKNPMQNGVNIHLPKGVIAGLITSKAQGQRQEEAPAFFPSDQRQPGLMVTGGPPSFQA